MPKLDIAQHTVVVSTEVLYTHSKYVTMQVHSHDGNEVDLTLDVAEAVALVRALDGALDDALTFNYMGGQTP